MEAGGSEGTPVTQENPYRSPLALAPAEEESDRPAFASRGRAIAGGAWRGAKLGSRLMGMIVGTLLALLWFAAIAAVLYRWLIMGGDIGWIMEKTRPLQLFGVTFLAATYSTVLAAMVSAIIMGTAAGISYRASDKTKRGG
jgi:hypothetical protein